MNRNLVKSSYLKLQFVTVKTAGFIMRANWGKLENVFIKLFNSKYKLKRKKIK